MPRTKKQLADLNHAIESTLTVARNEWKYTAEVVTDLDASLPPVPCLLSEFNQVILNLVVNASHAIADTKPASSVASAESAESAELGEIRIRTSHDDRWALIEISDNGAGIPDDIRDKIFDAFFTTKEVGKGTGQGLAIARSIVVDKHQGEIDVRSEARGGTTFSIRLPLKDPGK